MLFATPWWVNLLALVPVGTYVFYRRRGLTLDNAALVAALAFGLAFGFVEAAVVVYLRAATGLLSGAHVMTWFYPGTTQPNTAQVLAAMPQALVNIEEIREAATMVMLVSVALLAARERESRVAIFLWTFAAWDIAYYLGLKMTIHWPSSFRETDVLFLIPQPWIAQVWYPLAVSLLTMAAVVLGKKSTAHQAEVPVVITNEPATESDEGG